jgi:hypothetical protein
MMVMVMVIVMVMVMVTIPKALSLVSWLRHHQSQSFNRLKAFHWPKLPQTQSSIGTKIPAETLLLPAPSSLMLVSEASS